MPQLGSQHDDAIYWVTAKSLAAGNGYRIASLPGQPWETKYPPLFSLYLSAVWRMVPRFPENLPVATLFCWAWLPVWLTMTWLLFRDLGASSSHARLLCCVLAVSPHAVLFGVSPMVEVMFSALWMASAALAVRTRGSVRWAALAGLVGGAAYLTKSAALPLVVVIPLYFGLRKQYRSAAAFTAAMAPAIAGWTLWARFHQANSGDVLALYYTNYFGYHLYNVSLHDVPQVVLKNLERLLWALGGALSGVGESNGTGIGSHLLLATGIWRTLAVAAIVFTIRHIRRIGFNPYHGFAAAYLLLLLFWHFPPNERFAFPVLPVLLAALPFDISQVKSLWRPYARPARWALAGGLTALTGVWAALIGVHLTLGITQTMDRARRQLAANRAAYRWIAGNTPAGAVFLAYDDPLLYLYTGRAGCRRIVPTRFFYEDDRDGVKQVFASIPTFAREHQVQYLLASAADWHGELLPSDLVDGFNRIAEGSTQQRLVFRTPLARVYRFEHD